MNNDEILKAAKLHGRYFGEPFFPTSIEFYSAEELLGFARAIEAATREECAKVCNRQAKEFGNHVIDPDGQEFRSGLVRKQ